MDRIKRVKRILKELQLVEVVEKGNTTTSIYHLYTKKKDLRSL